MINDPNGYWWPPTYSIWTHTIRSFNFSVSTQLTIFSIFVVHDRLELSWGPNGPGGYWWPPTYSILTPTIISFSFLVSAQLIFFSSFLGPELPDSFWGPKRHYLGKLRATLLISSNEDRMPKLCPYEDWCSNLPKQGKQFWCFIS